MPSFSDDLDPDLIEHVKDEYKKAAFWLPFKAIEIQKVFSEEELSALADLVRDMKDASTDNQRKTAIIQNINKYGGTLVKLLRMAKVIA